MQNQIEITEREFTSLQYRSGIARIYYQRASLEVEGKGDDARFVMRGPSGVHTLLVSSTDLERLNAHWVNFAQDARNTWKN